MDTGICPGNCNYRYRQAWEEYRKAVAAYDPLNPDQARPEPPQIQPVHGDPIWCGRCKGRIRGCLAELDSLAAQLAWHADGYPTALAAETGRVSGTAETMSPSEAADELTDLMNILGEHETAYRDFKRMDAPHRRGYLASVSSETIAWLGWQLDALLASPPGEGFGRDVLEWHRQWKRKAKAGVRRLPKPLRCPDCRMLMLVWEEGSDRVECNNPDCARVFSYAEYEAMVTERAGRGHASADVGAP